MKIKSVTNLLTWIICLPAALSIIGLIVAANLPDSSKQKIDWWLTKRNNKTDAYHKYINNYPNSPHIQEALKRYEELFWLDAEEANTVTFYESYVEKFPSGQHLKDARRNIEDLVWQKAKEDPSFSNVDYYLRQFPNGRYLSSASTLRWQITKKKKKPSILRSYLKQFPNSPYAAEARVELEKMFWQKAKEDPSLLRSYLKQFPNSPYAAEAKVKLEKYEWLKAKEDPSLLRSYLKQLPNSPYAAEAKVKLEEYEWSKVDKRNNIASYLAYQKEFPENKYKRTINAKISKLKQDDTIFNKAKSAGTILALESFLYQYPGHRRTQEANRLIKYIEKTNSIANLVKNNKVEALVQADNFTIAEENKTKEVHVVVRNLFQQPQTVIFPIGTYFECLEISILGLVSTKKITMHLTTRQPTFWLPVVYADISGKLPNKHAFRITDSPYPELIKLLPVLVEKTSNPLVLQALVWIVSHNTNFRQLGALVTRPLLSPKPIVIDKRRGLKIDLSERQIKSQEAAEAMRILNEVGINIKQKRIWQDRQYIYKNLEPGELKDWLKKISRL
jgi:outer membrane protein assembly factor BamD (BamD/ComL family)